MIHSNDRSLWKSSLAGAARAFSLLIFSALLVMRLIFVLVGETGALLQLLASGAFYMLIRFLLFRKPEIRVRLENFCLLAASLYSMSLFLEPGRNVVWALFLVLVYLAYAGSGRLEMQRSSAALAAFISAFFSLAMFIGSQLVSFGRLEILYFSSWEELALYTLFLYVFKIFGLAAFFFALLYRLFAFLRDKSPAFAKEHSYSFRLWAAGPALVLLFLLCWLPYLAAYYPGIYHPDSIGELNEVLGSEQMMGHHPVFHLMFIKLCLYLGGLFGSVEAGLLCYSLLQMLIQASVFSAAILYLAEKRLSPWLLFPLGLFFALYMAGGFYSIYMVKDVLFGCITLALLLMLTEESLCNKRGVKRGAASLAALTLVSFLFCISRNNGIYAFLLGFLLYALCNRERIKRYAVIYAAVLLLFAGYNYTVYNVMGIAKGRSAEMLSVPLQQIARTVKLYPEELESPEAQVLREVFPDMEQLGGLYKSYISDPVKAENVFSSETFDAEPLRYARAWLGLGLRHPQCYIDAMLLQCYGYFYPNLDVGGTVNLGIPPNSYGIERSESGSLLRSRLSNTYGYYSSNQPTSVFHSIGFAVWLIILSAGIFAATGRAKLAAPCFILLGKWLTILLSPVFCEFRYVYCLFICAPVVLVMSLGLEREPGSRETEAET